MIRKLFLMIFMVAGFSVEAQPHYVFPFQNPNLSVEERVNDLVTRLTLEEKISQMVYTAPAIERLGIPEYNWWNECLHGVARNGIATVFPQAIGLSAMWDKDMMYNVASAISDEARAKYNQAVSMGRRGIYQGLTFWSPNINIFRDPRWGRGMETYGEDPYLTGQTALQFVKGLQGNDPKYLKTVATSKHFAVHSGPEPLRHSFDTDVSEYDLHETYLPAFRTTVIDGNVQSIMCAYNSFRSKACCSNDPLLNNILRNEWGFKGYVVSDCWAIMDIYKYHKQAADVDKASALAVKAGTDLNCGIAYKQLFNAVMKNLVSESEIDVAVKRLFAARIKMGMFDPPGMVPYSKIDIDVVNSKRNQKLALEAARESIVLLKNDSKILPLKKNLRTIAVIGPNANNEEVLLGNYNGTPLKSVTPLEGIKNKVGKSTEIIYEKGCDLADNMPEFEVIPTEYLFTSADKKQHGLKAQYFNNTDWKDTPYIERVDKIINFKWLQKSPDKVFEGNKSIRWSGYLVPPKTGSYYLAGYGFNGFNFYLEDSLLEKFENDHGPSYTYKLVDLIAGKPYKIRIDFFNGTRYGQMKLMWDMQDNKMEQRAVDAAKKSDAVIMFMGLSPNLEGEEMKVPVKGFKGGDRLTLDLPELQENLIKKVYAAGKPVVLVLQNGSALSINWENKNIPAIVESWYGGQAAGSAIADVLFGDYNPAGKLPVTFYQSVDQLPEFTDYNMKGRTYRYFDGDVIYPFGYGLSYSEFKFSNLRLSKQNISLNESTKLFVDVKNISMKNGDEVIQLYVKGKGLDENDAIKSLKGFERVSFKAGQSQTVEFDITPQTLQTYKTGKGFVVEKGEHILLVGSSSNDPDLQEIKLSVE